jgi:hypothetical protein
LEKNGIMQQCNSTWAIHRLKKAYDCQERSAENILTEVGIVLAMGLVKLVKMLVIQTKTIGLA